jgi:Tfp pilus assembly PilM family ATPase
MHRAEVDPKHNRLILRWVDSLSLTEVDRLQAEIATLLPQLQPGFDCISDIANMRPTSQHIASRIEKLQAFLHESGMRRVVRIVGKGGGARIASTQMDRTAERAGYSTIHVDTEAEAFAALGQEPASPSSA